jgi:hypothetical protein
MGVVNARRRRYNRRLTLAPGPADWKFFYHLPRIHSSWTELAKLRPGAGEAHHPPIGYDRRLPFDFNAMV